MLESVLGDGGPFGAKLKEEMTDKRAASKANLEYLVEDALRLAKEEGLSVTEIVANLSIMGKLVDRAVAKSVGAIGVQAIGFRFLEKRFRHIADTARDKWEALQAVESATEPDPEPEADAGGPYIVSANYRDKTSRKTWLVRREAEPIASAREVEFLVAVDVEFIVSDPEEAGFGCRVVAKCGDVVFPVRNPKHLPSRLTFNEDRFEDSYGKKILHVHRLALRSDGNVTAEITASLGDE